MSGHRIFYIGEKRELSLGLARQFENSGYPVHMAAEPDETVCKGHGLLLISGRHFHSQCRKKLAPLNGGRLYKVALLPPRDSESGLLWLREGLVQDTLELPLTKHKIKLLLAKWRCHQVLHQRLQSLKRLAKERAGQTAAKETASARRDLWTRYLYRIPVRRILEVKLNRLIEEACGAENGARLYQEIIAQVEKPLLESVLEKVAGNKVKAAKILGLSRNTLLSKLKALKLA